MPVPAGPGSPVYGDLATLKAMLGIPSADTTRDALLTVNLASASRQVEKKCGRRFYADGATSQRTYTPERRQAWYGSGGVVQVDDISTATGLIIEVGYQGYTGSPVGSWTDCSNDFVLQPDNAFALGRPVSGLRRAIGVIEDPYTLVRVTANWGWPVVPDEVNLAALLLAERVYRRKDSPEGFIGNSGWGTRGVVQMDPDVDALLSDFMKAGWA